MIEFVDDRLGNLENELIDMTVDDVQLRGIYEVDESGSGFTEKYRSEREHESGGSDEVDEPPAAELNLTAWGTWSEFQELDALRDREGPFPVSIGPFAFDEMGIADLQGKVSGKYPGAVEISIMLKEYREITVQRETIDENVSGGSTYPQDTLPPPGSSGTTSTTSTSGTDSTTSGSDSSDPGDGAGTGTGDVGSIQTETIASEARPTYTVGSDETWGGVLLDNNGGRPVISASGSNWTIRDVGLSGTFNGSSGGNGDAFMGLRADGGDNLVENVYMGDGATQQRSTGIWVNNSSASDASIRFRHLNGQRWQDNFIYASAPDGTEIIIEESYAQDNGITSYRLKNGSIRDCVAYHNGANTPTTGRCIWGWGGGGHIAVYGGDYYATDSSQYVLAGDGGGSPASMTITGGATLEGPIAGNTSGVEWGDASQSGANIDNYSSGVPETAADAAEGN